MDFPRTSRPPGLALVSSRRDLDATKRDANHAARLVSSRSMIIAGARDKLNKAILRDVEHLLLSPLHFDVDRDPSISSLGVATTG